MSSQVLSSLWDSAPELASNQTVIQHVFLVVNSFLHLDFIVAIIHVFICQIAFLAQWLERCALEARDCQFSSKRCAFALVARAREAFLNLRNRNSHLPKNKTILTHSESQHLREACNQCVRTNLFSLLLYNCL